MRPSLALLILFFLASCGLSREEFHDLVEESRACEPGDSCVLVGSSQCTCAVAVNAKHRERVEEAASEVRCDGIMVKCAAFESVGCEAGRCVGW